MHQRDAVKDRGYSWVILVASFLSHVLLYGIVWSAGVFYVIFLEHFEGDRSAIALIASLNITAFYGSGPISSALTNMFGPRVVAMVGAAIGSLGLILTMFATSIIHLYITFGIITGFGFGLTYVPAISIIGAYFERLRSIAFGIAVSGVGIGSFIFPPIIQLFASEYGWQGAMLLSGGVSLNLIAISALLRPQKEIDAQTNTHKTHPVKVKQKKYILEACNFHILKDVNYLLLCFNNLLFCFSWSVVYVHLSAYAVTLGFSNDQGAWIISAMGIACFIGRVVFGILGNIPGTNTLIIYLVAFMCTGVVAELCPLANTFTTLVIFAAAFGFFSSSIGPLLPQVTVDILGTNLLTSGYGYLLIFDATGTLLGGPVAGWLYGINQEYTSSFIAAGAALVLSALMMMYKMLQDFKPNKETSHEIVDAKIISSDCKA